MKYQIFQIPNEKLKLQNEELNRIFSDLSVFSSKKWLPRYFYLFSKVNEIDANNLEDVFNRLNTWEQDEQTHRSLSVGDIVLNVALNEYYIVKSFGFEKVEVS